MESSEIVPAASEITPTSSVIICATPRSGSYLLCEALENTGRCGHAEEFLWARTRAETCAEWGIDPADTRGYLAEMLRRGTSSNGVFAIKLMWGYLPAALHELRSGMADVRSLGPHDVLRTAFREPTFVWMRRRDIVRQAVSFWKAAQTDVWRVRTDAERGEAAELMYDFDQIDYFRREIELHDRSWKRFFASNDITPIEVVYEELVDAYEDTALRVLAGCSIPTDGIEFAPRTMRRQADAINDQWHDRYWADAHEQRAVQPIRTPRPSVALTAPR